MSIFNIFSRLFHIKSEDLPKCSCDICVHCTGTGIEPHGKIYIIPDRIINDVVCLPPEIYCQPCISCCGTRKITSVSCPIHGKYEKGSKKTA